MGLGLRYNEFSVRLIGMEDANLMLEWRNAPIVRNGMFSARVINLEEHLLWLRNMLSSDRRFYYFACFRSEPYGVFGSSGTGEPHRTAEWDFYMGNSPARLKGFGVAMEFMALDQIFHHHGVRKLWCQVMTSNDRVIKMHERFGFCEEGRLIQHVVKDNEMLDVVLLALQSREWSESRERKFLDIFGDDSPTEK